MKNILVVYYTQSGQTKDIVDSIFLTLKETKDIKIHYESIKPKKEFPYPWGGKFFNCFPESVKGIPCELEAFSNRKDIDYDLVVLAYQPWYLSPSIPVWSFLNSEDAKSLFRNKKVITIIGARNMWICSQEIVVKKLIELKAKLRGNIVLTDRTSNYISVINIIRWLIAGKKGPTMLLPEAGVVKKDIVAAARFGTIIQETIRENDWENLQNKLLEEHAVKVKYHIFKIEKNARKIFDKFAGYVLKKGQADDPKRNKRIRVFKFYLLFTIFVVFPFVSFIFMVVKILFPGRTNKKILYYSSIDIE